MFKCDLCDKKFDYKSHLDRHKENKKPCKKIKKIYNCNICNSDFKFECDLKRHERTKKHIINNIENQNIHNGDNININTTNNTTNNINNIINLTINMNPFSETDLSNIRPSLITTIASETYEEYLDKDIKILNNRKTEIVFGCFSKLIEVFQHTNFNIAFTDNYNFKILLLFNSNKKLFEYLMLEKNINTNTFEWKQIGYNDFLGEFIYLMNLISKKIKCDNFCKVIDYLDTNLINNVKIKELLKPRIENELNNMYNKYREQNNLKPREFGDENDNIDTKMEYYHLFRRNECRFDNGFDPKIVNSLY